MRTDKVGGCAVAVVAFLLAVSSLVQAQVPGDTPNPGPQLTTGAVWSDAPPNLPEWGIGARNAYVVPGFSFSNLQDSQHGRTGGYIYRSGGTWNFFDQTIHLPTGALVDGVTVYYYDADPAADVNFYFYRSTGSSGVGFTPTNLLTDSSSGSTGYQGGYRQLAAPETILNYNYATGETSYYMLTVNLEPSAAATNLRFGAATVWWKQQVSPPPATATFTDVPTNYWAFQYIEALAASGITAGCGGGLYCPGTAVTRDQMAVFLAKALGLHWYDSN
jgi:hypothetical protein